MIRAGMTRGGMVARVLGAVLLLGAAAASVGMQFANPDMPPARLILTYPNTFFGIYSAALLGLALIGFGAWSDK
jgi:hypothetical protein